MPIDFPLVPPASPAPSSISFSETNLVGANVSPFTAEAEVQEWPGEYWGGTISYPPMKRPQAEPILAFLSALRGSSGTFLQGDPAGKYPQGLATHSSDPFYPDFAVNYGWGSNAGSKSIAIMGAAPNVSGLLKAGDYLQVNKNFLSYVNGLNVSSVWTVNQGTVSLGVADPWGGNQACRITPTPSSGDTYVRQMVNPIYGIASRQVTFSVWLRAVDGARTFNLYAQSEGYYTRFSTPVTIPTTWTRVFLTGTMAPTDQGAIVVIGSGGTWPVGSGPIDIFCPSLTCDVLGLALYKSLGDVTSDAYGNFAVDVFPRLRETYDYFSKVTLVNPQGSMRLSSNTRKWSVSNAGIYQIEFEFVEDL